MHKHTHTTHTNIYRLAKITLVIMLYLVSCLIAVAKYSTKSNFKKEAPQSIQMEASWWQDVVHHDKEVTAAEMGSIAHTMSTVKKRRMRNNCSQLTFSLHQSETRAPPMVPPAFRVELPASTYLDFSLREVLRNLCPWRF